MSIGTEISRLENAKAAITTAITGKGVTVPSGTKLDDMAALIDSIEAGGGGEVLNFFGGSKYYITEVTPTSDIQSITITPDDATILNSLKFLLVVQDIPARAVARAPSGDNYISAAIACSIGQVHAWCITCIDADNWDNGYSFLGTSVDEANGFNSEYIYISGGGVIVDAESTRTYFKDGQTYKVLLIG